jgi:flavin-binding protein dodecin
MTAVKEFEKTKKETATPETKVSGVVKIIEVIGTSKIGFDDAIATAIKTASHSLRHITGADVKHMTVAAAEGTITEYRVDLKLAFALDADDEDDD